MEFRALKHKTHPDQWGIFMEDGEIAMCSVPELFPMSASADLMNRYWTGNGRTIDWTDYELVIIELKIK